MRRFGLVVAATLMTATSCLANSYQISGTTGDQTWSGFIDVTPGDGYETVSGSFYESPSSSYANNFDGLNLTGSPGYGSLFSPYNDGSIWCTSLECYSSWGQFGTAPSYQASVWFNLSPNPGELNSISISLSWTYPTLIDTIDGYYLIHKFGGDSFSQGFQNYRNVVDTVEVATSGAPGPVTGSGLPGLLFAMIMGCVFIGPLLPRKGVAICMVEKNHDPSVSTYT